MFLPFPEIPSPERLRYSTKTSGPRGFTSANRAFPIKWSMMHGCRPGEKSQPRIASGVLNAARQVGSAVGVALFGTFIDQKNQMIPGLRIVLLVSCAILFPSSLLAPESHAGATPMRSGRHD